MSLSPRFPLTPRRGLSHGPSPLSTPDVDAEFQGIDIIESDMETGGDAESDELKVTFYPPLFMQRRIWILDILRKEGVTSVLDIGCGEGQLLSALAQPAPWLLPPPPSILPPESSICLSADEIINLHIKRLYGVDISEPDLAFAKQNIAPPPPPQPTDQVSAESIDLGGKTPVTPVHVRTLRTMRWEDLDAKLWLGGLEVPNEEFLDIECIVSSEVIEHLPEHIFPFYAPVILGIYQPRIFLLTTPSYTFNARFTAPDAPKEARRGYTDPTGRTDRIFRHDDHKFEWTLDEFNDWCIRAAEEWDYEVEVSSIGRSQEEDPYGRDNALGGASQVAAFRKKDAFIGKREVAANLVNELWKSLEAQGHQRTPHKLLASERHFPHPTSKRPSSIQEIGQAVKTRMEAEREAFVRFEEAWFDPEISSLCGGWLELLLQAVETSAELSLQKEGKQSAWMIELIGGPQNLRTPLWSNAVSRGMQSLHLGDSHYDGWNDLHDGERSVDMIPPDWIPGEEGSCYGEGESGEDRDWESTAAEGDVSWNGSENGDDDGVEDEDDENGWGSGHGWGNKGKPGWGFDEQQEVHTKLAKHKDASDAEAKETMSGSGTSTAGWDGDASSDTS